MHKSRVWLWAIPASLVSVAGLVVAVEVAMARANPILKERVVETLHARFGSDVQLDSLQVSITHGVEVSGSGLRIYPPYELKAAGNSEPVIAVRYFDFHASVAGLIFKPTHVGEVNVRGLVIRVPPANMRRNDSDQKRYAGKVRIRVDRFVCDDSQLVIGTDKPDKDPHVFLLKHVVLKDLGPGSKWPFDAILTNPIPHGEIHATGTLGPWDTDDPGDSKVEGKFVFGHADLNTIKGLGGILSSAGEFAGELDRIAVHGSTEVPDFSLDSANHPMPLSTTFQATVDGTSGDTYLESIQAKLGNSAFSCQGAVVDIKGKGHIIQVNTNVPNGQIADFLGLAVKASPAPMTGLLALTARLQIAPGRASVSQKIKLQGSFTLRQIHFTNPAIEDKVDLLSLRAQGETNDLKPGAPDVTSKMSGQFVMQNGELAFSRLDYALPGGNVHLTGDYTMDGRKYEFVGKVQTQAAVSKMVASKWKSILLKPVDPFFSKKGWGAEIPIKVSSDKDGKPKFGFRL